jgi:hypothetical protein
MPRSPPVPVRIVGVVPSIEDGTARYYILQLLDGKRFTTGRNKGYSAAVAVPGCLTKLHRRIPSGGAAAAADGGPDAPMTPSPLMTAPQPQPPLPPRKRARLADGVHSCGRASPSSRSHSQPARECVAVGEWVARRGATSSAATQMTDTATEGEDRGQAAAAAAAAAPVVRGILHESS